MAGGWQDAHVHMTKMAGCLGLLVALVGCGGPGGTAPVPSSTSPVPGVTARAEASPSVDPDSVSVLVTFVGGPADGRTEYVPMLQATGKVTVSGVTYQGSPGPPPEVKDTPQGLAEVLRPVRGGS